MPFLSGTSPTGDSFEGGHKRLFRIFRRFITGAPSVGTVGYTGTGNGVIGLIDTGVGGPTETWTITFTSATAFTVSGSVSGAQTGGTVGTNYTSDSPAGRLSFRIEAGGTPFINGDAFTIPVTENTAVTGNNRWVIDRWDPFSSTLELIVHGLGLAGTDEIYLGFLVWTEDSNQRWQIRMRGYTGFSPSEAFFSQPGSSGEFYTPLWNQEMPFWLAVNGRRIILVARTNTTYHAFYTGFILPYATPQEYPYPLMICGEHPLATQVSFTNLDLNHFVDPSQGETIIQGQLRMVGGVWKDFRQNISSTLGIWPYDTSIGSSRDYLLNMEPIGSSYPIFPCNIIDPNTSSAEIDADLLGYLDGAFAIPGFGQAAENTITIGPDTYRVFQNVYRTGRADFWCLKEA